MKDDAKKFDKIFLNFLKKFHVRVYNFVMTKGVTRQNINFDGKFWPFCRLFVRFRHLKGLSVI